VSAFTSSLTQCVNRYCMRDEQVHMAVVIDAVNLKSHKYGVAALLST
jgi:redox-regulated HSP33 family molecular chaperone